MRLWQSRTWATFTITVASLTLAARQAEDAAERASFLENDALARFDFWAAKAQLAVEMDGVRAETADRPTVVLLGSFLVPATAVIWYLDHYHSDVVTPAVARCG